MVGLYEGHGIPVCKMKALQNDSSDACMVMQMCLLPLECALKDDYDDMFYVYFLTIKNRIL